MGNKLNKIFSLFSLATVMHSNKCDNGFKKKMVHVQVQLSKSTAYRLTAFEIHKLFLSFLFPQQLSAQSFSFAHEELKPPSWSRIWNCLEQKENFGNGKLSNYTDITTSQKDPTNAKQAQHKALLLHFDLTDWGFELWVLCPGHLCNQRLDLFNGQCFMKIKNSE